MHFRSTLAALPTLLLLGCSGDEETPAQPTAEYACLHVTEGDIVDVAGTRDTANTVPLGRTPYRVNMLPDVAGFLRVDTGSPTDVIVLLDEPETLAAVWRGEDREELPAGVPNSFCDEDIPDSYEFQLASGANWLELGPVFQANIWLMIAPP